MAAILIVLGVVIAPAITLAIYACCVASGRESRREEKDACFTCGKAGAGCRHAIGEFCTFCPDWKPKDGD
jgi:hypothetical protein